MYERSTIKAINDGMAAARTARADAFAMMMDRIFHPGHRDDRRR